MARCVICAEECDLAYSGMKSDGCHKINVLEAAETFSPGYVP